MRKWRGTGETTLDRAQFTSISITTIHRYGLGNLGKLVSTCRLTDNNMGIY